MITQTHLNLSSHIHYQSCILIIQENTQIRIVQPVRNPSTNMIFLVTATYFSIFLVKITNSQLFVLAKSVKGWNLLECWQRLILLLICQCGVILIIRNQMGCGAICGDSSTVATSTSRQSHQAFQNILPHLNKNSKYASNRTFASFMSDYSTNFSSFHLPVPFHLTKDEPISSNVLLKWKMIVLRLDAEDKEYCNCLGLSDIISEQHNQELIQATAPQQQTLIAHDCFVQIEKDLDRTFPLPEGRKKEFENVLKRIANFFPQMGYTQGINFMVGYLIIVGYTESQAFWLFVHMAINRRYLLLGLYQDSFPLSILLTTLFKNVLRRECSVLYRHLYEQLEIDSSFWVFKWFMTCYVYSFPLQMVKYVWDIIFQIGCLGIVTFAIGITKQIEGQLLQKEDMADLSQFFGSLKQIEVINRYINLQIAVAEAYRIEIIDSDFEGTGNIKGFYAEYLKNANRRKNLGTGQQLNETMQRQNEAAESSLNQWHRLLHQKRLAFVNTQKTNSTSIQLGIQSTQKPFIQKDSSNDDFKITVIEAEDPPTGSSSEVPAVAKRRGSHDFRADLKPTDKKDPLVEFIDNFQDRARSISISSNRSKKSSVNIQIGGDELDRLEYQVSKKLQMVPYGKKLGNFYDKPHIEVKKDSMFREIQLHNYNSDNPSKRNSLAMAGQKMIRVDSIEQISESSKNSRRSVKRNQLSIPQNLKMKARPDICKTHANKAPPIDQSSDLQQSKDQLSDIDSLSNKQYSHKNGGIRQNASVQYNQSSVRQRLNTQYDYMVASHGPAMKEKQFNYSKQDKKVEPEIDIEFMHFKKNKRQIPLRNSQQIESRLSVNRDSIIHTAWQHEESLDSIPFPSGQMSVASRNQQFGDSHLASCEIESIR